MNFSRRIEYTCHCGYHNKIVVTDLSETGVMQPIDDKVKEQIICHKCKITMLESDQKIKGVKVG